MIHAAVVVFIRRSLDFEPRVLTVTNRGFGGTSLPGGKVDLAELPRETAKREVHEETGITVLESDLTLIARGISIRPGSHIERADVSVFFARFAWGEPRNVEPGTEHAWLTFKSLCLTSPFAQFYQDQFPDGLYHLRETIFADAATTPRT